MGHMCRTKKNTPHLGKLNAVPPKDEAEWFTDRGESPSQGTCSLTSGFYFLREYVGEPRSWVATPTRKCRLTSSV